MVRSLADLMPMRRMAPAQTAEAGAAREEGRRSAADRERRGHFGVCIWQQASPAALLRRAAFRGQECCTWRLLGRVARGAGKDGREAPAGGRMRIKQIALVLGWPRVVTIGERGEQRVLRTGKVVLLRKTCLPSLGAGHLHSWRLEDRE